MNRKLSYANACHNLVQGFTFRPEKWIQNKILQLIAAICSPVLVIGQFQ